ncbi:MAG: Fic family protein [Acidimicrobiaceae bacterium]|nr:Fic family protein [Acidimicrobiaceae bacterium]
MGVVKASDLGGYRQHAVFLSGSRYVPMNWSAVPEAMSEFFDLLEKEDEPSVRAVLGHFVFVYIHPYPDGNGRMARFIMNLMLAGGGHPWTVIRVDDRQRYMTALESASVHHAIKPFATLVAERVAASDAAA